MGTERTDPTPSLASQADLPERTDMAVVDHALRVQAANPGTFDELVARINVGSATFEEINAWADALPTTGLNALGGERRRLYNAICTKFREAGDQNNLLLTRLSTEWQAAGKMAQWGASH